MSVGAIQQVVDELRELPETDQNLVLSFLQALKRKHSPFSSPPPRQGRNPALKWIDGLLVFTGTTGNPQADWLQVIREERETELMRPAPPGVGNS